MREINLITKTGINVSGVQLPLLLSDFPMIALDGVKKTAPDASYVQFSGTQATGAKARMKVGSADHRAINTLSAFNEH